MLDMPTGALVNLATGPGRGADKVWFRPDGGMVVRTATSDGKCVLVLRRADGSAIAFPDATEQASGRHLVAYHP